MFPSLLRKRELICSPLHLHNTLRSYHDFYFNLTLDSCSTLRDLKRVHALIIATGFHKSILLSTKFITQAINLSPTMDYARQLFDQMTDRDVFLWNTLIRGYSDSAPCQEALATYQRMHSAGVLPDCYTFSLVPRACAVLADLRVGKQAHCNVVKNGFDSVSIVKGSLVSMYSQCGETSCMELAFGEILIKNVVSWTALVSGYVQNGFPAEGLVAFRDMLGSVIKPNVITLVSVLPACVGVELSSMGRLIHGYGLKLGADSYVCMANALISFYGKSGDIDTAQSLYDQILVKDVVSWNTMIAIHEQNNNSAEAIRVFAEMQREEFDCHYITLVSVISACTRLGDLTTGRWIHELVRIKSFEANASIQNALIDMYSKCGDVESARNIFEKLGCRSVVCWTSMIGGCASHGHADLALELFSWMKEEGVKPNSLTYVAVLSACRHAGLVEEGKRHFESMSQDYSIVPRLEHCACMVDLLGRAGCLAEAFKFIQRMPIQPDVGVWGALLNACRLHGDVELAEVVAQRLFLLEPKKVTFYILMSQIYAESGRWDDAERLRILMEERDLEKIAGSSLVDMNRPISSGLVKGPHHFA